jgi:hypothetical protein
VNDWIIEETDHGLTLRHEGSPRFSAHWITGSDPDELAEIEGPCWTDEENGEETITLHRFQWRDPVPEQTDFDKLMAQACRVIDDWISTRF